MASTKSISTDPATQSNYHDIGTTHLHLDWTIDWKSKVIRGSVKHTMLALKDVTVAQFDSSFINIERITASDGAELKFDLTERHRVMGSKLTVQLPRAVKAGKSIDLKIEYATTSQCTALGWLTAAQTTSGKFPFLYSQCQAIHCRSLLPIQDTPSVKLTYSAIVRSPLPVLMSALIVSPPREEMTQIGDLDMNQMHEFKFEQPTKIPGYLIAVAAGELAFAPLGDRTGVWAEPDMLKAAAWEFKRDTERFVDTAEKMLTPYEWGRFDMLVLPYSFPFGYAATGMENPAMTFLTPALVVGDRSQVDVVAHELAHSWHGNLVSTEDWRSFWLNESWTTYTERLLIRELHGEPARQFSYIVGHIALNEAFAQMPPKYRRLHIDYQVGEDPDDAFSTVAYDLGACMLLHIERTVGGVEEFKPYHKAFIQEFAGRSIGTSDWLDHFHKYWSQFPEKHAAIKKNVDFDAWLYNEKLHTPVKMVFDTSMADNAYNLAARWDKARSQTKFPEFASSDIDGWLSNQVCMLLDTLHDYKPFSEAAVRAVDSFYSFEASSNPEIKLRWYLFALKSGFRAPEAAKWIQRQGRMKYARPVFRAINKVDPKLARATFKEAQDYYHPICSGMIRKDLGLD